jgi:hypothetical protein
MTDKEVLEAEKERTELYERDAVLRGLDKAAHAVATIDSVMAAVAAQEDRTITAGQEAGWIRGWFAGRQAALAAIEKARKELAP